VNQIRRLFMVLLFSVVAFSFIFTSTVMSGEDVAKEAFNEMWSIYVFCKYSDTKAYDVYNYTLGEKYALQAKKAYKKGKGPNFERAKYFSGLAMPHLKIVQKKYVDAEIK